MGILKVHFQPSTRGRAKGILNAYFNCTYKPNEAVALYGARVKEISESMEDAEIDLPVIIKIYQLIRYLPNTFSGIVYAIYIWP